MTETALYRHFDTSGALLYVGVTASPGKRLLNHLNAAEWAKLSATVTIEWHPSRDAAVKAEWAAIQEENPRFNIRRLEEAPSASELGQKKPRTPFGTWVKDGGRKQIKVAEDLGLSKAFVSQLCSGDRIPSLPQARAIEVYTAGSVSMHSWLEAS